MQSSRKALPHEEVEKMFDIEKYAVELRKDPSYRTIFQADGHVQ